MQRVVKKTPSRIINFYNILAVYLFGRFLEIFCVNVFNLFKINARAFACIKSHKYTWVYSFLFF